VNRLLGSRLLPYLTAFVAASVLLTIGWILAGARPGAALFGGVVLGGMVALAGALTACLVRQWQDRRGDDVEALATAVLAPPQHCCDAGLAAHPGPCPWHPDDRPREGA
jgi:hypothetical protein